MFGLLMSFGGMAIVIVKWFGGARRVYHDEEFHGYLAEVATIERSAFAMEAEGNLDVVKLKLFWDKLGGLRALLLERYPSVLFRDPLLFDRCIVSVRATHELIGGLIAHARETPKS
jgi:hypothetical protein